MTNRCLQISTCQHWRDKLSEQESAEIKNTILAYLEKIGATIEESGGLYTIQIPSKFESIFGGNQKRITFDSEVANTHSCELVIFGSNFLAIILDELKKQAPVISGHLRKQADFSKDLVNTFSVHRGTIKVTDTEDLEKTVIRFYFNVTLKSVKNRSVTQWVDIDTDGFKKIEFPEELEFVPLQKDLVLDKKSIETCYNKAIKILQDDINPIIEEHTKQTSEDLNQDLDSLESSFTKRVNEIRRNAENQSEKLRELDNKIRNAKNYHTRHKYLDQRSRTQEKMHMKDDVANSEIDRLVHDKSIQQKQITKRYTIKVTSTLIASQVFSYPITMCNLEILNQHSKNKTTGEYMGYSNKFVIICQVCNVNSKEIHLCVNGHVGCNLCSHQCRTCEKDFCQKCDYQLNSCYICKERNCNDCSSHCTFCHEFICTKDEMNCSICGKNFCTNHMKQCTNCEQTYSIGCVKNGLCNTCGELVSIDSKDSKVLEVISIDSELEKYKKWECAVNSKFLVFKAKKMLGKKIIVFDKIHRKIIVDKKDGWF